MSFSFKLRDFLLPRENILQEAGIEPGFTVLDYGCGPGSYTFVATRTVGESGKVYALDFHPLAIRRVKHIIAKKRLVNVATIYSDCGTGLPDQTVDAVLLYDVFHELSQPDKVLTELQRVLKPGGILSFNDHHIRAQSEILSRVTDSGLFRLSGKGKRVYNFIKVG
jgi:ubiquinone/menaquinone biosynthesis C-methylase UbiE